MTDILDFINEKEGCSSLNELLIEQIKVIRRHVNKHKYYMMTEDKIWQ